MTTTPPHSDARAYDDLTRAAAAEIDPSVDPSVMAFGLAIMRAGNRLQQDMETVVQRPAGTTWAAFRVLFTIRAVGPLTPKRLARLSNTSAASISSVLNTLERQGHVVRTPDSADGRSLSVALTDPGRELVERLFHGNNARTQQWASHFTEDERDTLIELLHRLLDLSPPAPEKTT